MLIYLSCKYYRTIYSSLVDVKASLRTCVQQCIQWDKQEPSLCLTSVLIVKSRGHFSSHKLSLHQLGQSLLSWCAIGKHYPLEGVRSTALAVYMLVRMLPIVMVLMQLKYWWVQWTGWGDREFSLDYVWSGKSCHIGVIWLEGTLFPLKQIPCFSDSILTTESVLLIICQHLLIS